MKDCVQVVHDMLRIIIDALVDDTSNVLIHVLEGKTIVVFEVFLSRLDIGKVIGKQGATIQSIRRILDGVSAKDQINYIIQVVED